VTLLHTSTADALRRRALWLEYLTIGWDVIEAAVAVAAGVAAGSIALVGFGFDSSIGVLAASTVVWQFRAELRGDVDEDSEGRTQAHRRHVLRTRRLRLGGTSWSTLKPSWSA
jgi:hypothetical protein